ncbi:SDR family NAD(P)-dependent oxidoreductase [Nocardioides luteus]|uniref:SDR family NAD(P)-dependent oxidoreductase n=1 Tax=Nocardioides luteus TaxID=1844 RepID=UPI0018CBE7A1|nr:SDR family oxidoreductase [Nocardioides luteus]MBG6095783.1 NAD(P)-dependent dehydrogenase (short-subunit alcohol dehydrogenase family) [Nocardioides luteus]
MSTRKVAVITGASQGIGAALVTAYQDLGYAVVANSRSIEPSSTETIETVAGDIGDAAVAQRVIATALERFGRVDTLVNNAGIFVAKPFTDYTVEDYEAIKSTNLDGFFHITQAALGQFLEQGEGGHVVSVTTTLVESASAAVPSVLASLSKGGVAAATKSLAVEYASRGIRVNAVSPGIIKTPMHAPETHDFLAALHPMETLGEVGDVTRGVLYLEQSPFVTGEFLHIDGGQSAGR